MKELIEELRAQANQHPLDADLQLFNVAASVIERLNIDVEQLKLRQVEYSVIRNAFYDGARWSERTINNGALALDKEAHHYAEDILKEVAQQ